MPSQPSRQVRRAQARQQGRQGKASAGGARRPPGGALLWAGGIAVLVIVAVVVVIATGSSSSKAQLTGSGYPNGDTSNTRDLPSTIDGANVSNLEVAWSLPLTARSQYGAYASTPVISRGVIYSQDLESNVQAIDLKSGKVIWSTTLESPDQGPNGVVVQNGAVFGATADAAFALDEQTGKKLWTVTLTRNEHEGIDMAPGYHEGIVYVSTVPGNNSKFYGGGGVGILWALDAKSGRRLWHFDTAPEGLWSRPSINSGGGLWYTPAFDAEGGMYIGTANPAPFPGTDELPWGSSRPGPNLYTDSLVKLNAKTGKLDWYYQATPHDLYDWDLQDPPILATVKGRQVVLGAGKSGLVVELDRQSGKLLWKRAVGTHNGHDHDSIYAMHHEYSKLKLPETVYPGLLGGVIAPMATDGSTVFVPIVNHGVTFNSQTETQEPESSTGEVLALDVETGDVRWRRPFSYPVFGSVTATNDLLFATTFDGKVYALDTNTGTILWEAQLSAGTNSGATIAEDLLIAPAGVAVSEGQTTEITAYRLPKSVNGG